MRDDAELDVAQILPCENGCYKYSDQGRPVITRVFNIQTVTVPAAVLADVQRIETCTAANAASYINAKIYVSLTLTLYHRETTRILTSCLHQSGS